MAPKKAALKEAEAELAVAMEVSIFTLSLSLSLSLVFILFLTCYSADFPIIAQALRNARVLKVVPNLR